MRSIAVAFSTLFLGVSLANAKIIGWIPQQFTEAEAKEIATTNAADFLENKASCNVEEISYFEAINHLKDINGNPLLVVLSEVETSGSQCEFQKYAECRTIFQKSGVSWVHDYTECDQPDLVRE